MARSGATSAVPDVVLSSPFPNHEKSLPPSALSGLCLKTTRRTKPTIRFRWPFQMMTNQDDMMTNQDATTTAATMTNETTMTNPGVGRFVDVAGADLLLGQLGTSLSGFG